MNWIRVTRKRKCPICDHERWCGISSDGTAAICMRVESGRGTRNDGWLHQLTDPLPVYTPPPRIQPRPNLQTLWQRWEKETDYQLIDGLAMSLGVDLDALQAVGCVWNGRAYGFPMRDAERALIGIRLRAPDGYKFAVTGSRAGLFIPERYPYCIDDATIYITEGPTDLAAAMTLGLRAIGRSSCLGQEEFIQAYLAKQKPRRVVIIADNDGPGFRGAQKLQSLIKTRSCLFLPPAKDLREFAALGGTANLIESSISDLVWKAA